MTTTPPAMPAPFQAYPAFWIMAAAPRPTSTHPQTIFNADSVAVSLNGKNAVGCRDMLSCTGVVLVRVPAEIIDLDILGVEVTRLPLPLCEVMM